MENQKPLQWKSNLMRIRLYFNAIEVYLMTTTRKVFSMLLVNEKNYYIKPLGTLLIDSEIN